MYSKVVILFFLRALRVLRGAIVVTRGFLLTLGIDWGVNNIASSPESVGRFCANRRFRPVFSEFSSVFQNFHSESRTCQGESEPPSAIQTMPTMYNRKSRLVLSPPPTASARPR